MAFTVEFSNDGGSTYSEINYASFDIEYGLSDVLLAPLAAVDVTRQAGTSTGDRLRIQEDGTPRFEGRLTTGGEVRSDGQTRLQAEHDIYPVFADSVSITVSNPTDEDVYDAALSAANGGGSFTLNYVGTPVALGDDYEVEDRAVKRIFKDMTDRTGRVFFVGVGDTITVAPRGDGGQFADLNEGDGYRVEKYNPGDIDTVRNAVTVNGTGGEQVSATATDSTSITDYGRRAKTYNFEYIRSSGEADSMASELLIPDPLADAELLLGRSVGAITDVQVNKTIDFNDPQGSGASDVLTIEKQTLSPGSTTVKLGEGAGVSIANVQRDNQSVEDTTQPGSVYNSDRIADGAVESAKLVDSSVITSKLADLAVELDKVDDGAIDTVKIKDDAIEAPKILAGTITANEIAADTLTANEIVAGTITALEIAADTLTANEIQTLQLDANQLEVGADADNQIIFETELLAGPGETVVNMRPSVDELATIGGFDHPFESVTARLIEAEDTDFDDLFAELATLGPLGNETLEVEGLGSETTLAPSTDGTCQIGYSGKNYSSVWAQEFIDEGTVVAGDGGDPLAGLADAVEPPEQCRVCDDDGNTEGVRVNSLARELWRICTAQQRRIDDLESRLADIEAKQE